MMTALLLTFALLFAPAPVEREQSIKPASVVMTWRGVECETVFHHDGFFACKWQGEWWNGAWSQSKGVLTVVEWPLSDPSRRGQWAVRLRGPTVGTLGTTPWRIRPAVGKIN